MREARLGEEHADAAQRLTLRLVDRHGERDAHLDVSAARWLRACRQAVCAHASQGWRVQMDGAAAHRELTTRPAEGVGVLVGAERETRDLDDVAAVLARRDLAEQ